MEPIIFKQGDTLQKSIRATDAASQPIKWTDVDLVQVAFIDYSGVQVVLFAIGEGLAINPDDDEDLVLTISPELNLAVSSYRYDIKIIFPLGIVLHSPTGDVQILESITK